jgi:hypothetical protein
MTMTEERPMVTPVLSEPLDRAALVTVLDPRERCRLAADSARIAAERAEKERGIRNSAGLQLAQTRKAVGVWRDTLGITRNLWKRITEDPDAKPGTYKDPEATAKRAADRTRHWEKIATDARAVRDATATGLMNGAYGPPARNAEVVALTGLSSARVAQLRTSY